MGDDGVDDDGDDDDDNDYDDDHVIWSCCCLSNLVASSYHITGGLSAPINCYCIVKRHLNRTDDIVYLVY